MNRSNENTRTQQIKFDKNKSKTQIQINVKIYRLPPLLFIPFFNQLKKKKNQTNPWGGNKQIHFTYHNELYLFDKLLSI